MNKIKKVTLLKDLPECRAGTVGILNGFETGYKFIIPNPIIWEPDLQEYTEYGTKCILNYPDWFQVEYEEDRWQVCIASDSPDSGIGKTWGKSSPLSQDRADELAQHLSKKMEEWLRFRCKKCGGKLEATGGFATDDKGNYRWKCETCGAVE